MFSAVPITASSNQARYVRAELAALGTYMISVGHRVEGPFDKARFLAAAEALVLRHEALRTSFDIRNTDVFAKVSVEARFLFHHCEFSEDSLATFRSWALPQVFKDVDPRLPGSLVRFLVAEITGGWRFTIAAHHAITDGFSRGVMNRELLKLYAGETLPDPRSYYDFTAPQAPDASVGEAARAYVQALPDPCRFYADGADDGAETGAGQIAERDFGELQKDVRALGKSIGATKFGVFAAAYALGLHGFTGELGVSSFFQTEGRKSLGAPNSVVGPFSNTVPLDLTVDPDLDFASFARQLSERVQKVVALENEGILDLTFDTRKAPTVSINMFPPASRIVVGDLDVGPREFLDRRAEFDLNLVWAEDLGTMVARAFYNASVISPARTRLFLDQQGRLLRAAIKNPQLRCREILTRAREGSEAVVAPKCLAPSPQQRLHEPFFERAIAEPDATAIVTSKNTLSYGELATRALSVMEAVLGSGAGEGDRIVILAQRDPRLVAEMLGVSASGAAFALIDASYPPERIQRMLERLDTRFVIDAGSCLPGDRRDGLRIISPDDSVPGNNPIVRGAPRDVAYCLFTSGTSGEPKLISRPDRTTQRFTRWQIDTLALPVPVATIMMAGLAHDPTLRDVFLPLSYGGRIAVPTQCEMADPAALRRLFSAAGCNVVRFSASSARLLTAGAADGDTFDDLRGIFWGGERLPPASVRHWRIIAPSARQFCVFGTTETPQAFLLHEIDPDSDRCRVFPVGRPLPYTGARIVTEEGAPVALGEVGEIVADLPDPVLGRNQRLPNDRAGSAGQHYTGDLGFLMGDGCVYLIGRRDQQVKLNGFRVELGEIEAHAEALPGVQRACALLTDDRLMLFVLSESPQLTESTVRTALARNLPSYMMPVRIVVTRVFPVTQNGKIDKAALRNSIQADISTPDHAAAAPASRAERAVAAILVKRAGRAGASRDQSLFDLGADSLSTIEARLDLEDLGIVLPDDWQWMSVADLARLKPAPATVAQSRPSLLDTARVETMVLLRAIAIVIVVAHHSGFELGVGASITLFALAGFSFARLQLPAVLMDDHSGRIWALIGRLVVPLVLVMALYTAINAYRGVPTHVSSILFYRNLAQFIESVFLASNDRVEGLFWLWFLHAYIQIFAVLGVLLSFPGVRRILKQDSWRALLVFFALSEAVSVFVPSVFYLKHADFHHIIAVLSYAPTTMMPFIAVGALVAVADTPGRRILSLGCALVHFIVCQVFFVAHHEIWWVVSLALGSVLPFISLPRIASKVVVPVAAFSLMIYLTHVPSKNLFEHFLGSSQAAMAASVMLQIMLGVALGVLMRPVLDRLGVNRLAEKRMSF